MAVAGHPGVWAVGDSAAIPDLVTGGFCPPTAQFALRQGKRLAQNIAAVLNGQEPEPFRFKSLGLLAGLGHRSAVAEILGFRFSGFIAWWLWHGLRRGGEVAPFIAAMGLFLMCYVGLGISLWPNVVPHSINLWEAAGSAKSQAFLLVGTLFLLPVVLMYTGWSYYVFRGKVRGDIGYHVT